MKGTLHPLPKIARRVAFYVTLAGMLLGMHAPVWANLILNPSFEDVVIGLPFFSSNPAHIPHWTHMGAGGDALLVRVGFSDFAGSVTVAGDGQQFVVMGAGFQNSPAPASWEQTITGIAPGQYRLDFMMASEFDTFGQSITVEFPSGSSTLAQTFSAAPSSANYWRNWENKSMLFDVTSSSATVRFTANTTADVGLDNVRVDPVIAVIPEPTTLTLLGIGLAALVAAYWRRKK